MGVRQNWIRESNPFSLPAKRAVITPLQRQVVNILSDKVISHIPHFSVGANQISGKVLQSMGTAAIRRKGKKVTFDSSLPRNVAAYNSNTDTMRISGNPEGSLDMRAIVVHECTHMVQDSEKMKMTVLDSEAMAFIVQCSYFLLKAPPGTSVVPPAGLIGALLGCALDVARALNAGNPPKENDLTALKMAIKAVGLYTKTVGNLMVTNG